MLDGGWNLIALTVSPGSSDLQQLLRDISGLVLVKNVAGQHYVPAYSVNDLSAWDVTDAYEVLVASDATLAVEGTPLAPGEVPIELSSGWNLLPYFLDTPRALESALAPILDKITYAQDAAGGIYDPAAGIDTIGDLIPGQGYRVHLSDAAVLIYAE